MDTIDKIRQVAEQVCKDQGIDLFDVNLVGSKNRTVLRVFIDCATGITVEDCAKISRELSTALDVLDPFAGPYSLEVSSPGIDRPIRHTEDARKMIGKKVKITTKKEINGRRNFKGRLMAVRGEVWIVLVDETEVEIASGMVEKANMVFEF